METRPPIDPIEQVSAGNLEDVMYAGNVLTAICHSVSYNSGWWTNKGGVDMRQRIDPAHALRELVRAHTGAELNVEACEKIAGALNIRPTLYNVAEKLMLTVSELGEGMEGDRKSKMDDHLPEYPMLIVELADTVIRAFDLSGAQGYKLGTVIAAKLSYNMNRPDHKKEVRELQGGKTY